MVYHFQAVNILAVVHVWHNKVSNDTTYVTNLRPQTVLSCFFCNCLQIVVHVWRNKVSNDTAYVTKLTSSNCSQLFLL